MSYRIELINILREIELTYYSTIEKNRIRNFVVNYCTNKNIEVFKYSSDKEKIGVIEFIEKLAYYIATNKSQVEISLELVVDLLEEMIHHNLAFEFNAFIIEILLLNPTPDNVKLFIKYLLLNMDTYGSCLNISKGEIDLDKIYLIIKEDIISNDEVILLKEFFITI